MMEYLETTIQEIYNNHLVGEAVEVPGVSSDPNVFQPVGMNFQVYTGFLFSDDARPMPYRGVTIDQAEKRGEAAPDFQLPLTIPELKASASQKLGVKIAGNVQETRKGQLYIYVNRVFMQTYDY
jgi:hypothetical protein